MAQQKTGAAPPPFDEMPKQATEMMASMARMQGHVLDAVMKQNIEVLDFLKARFERDRKLVGEMSAVGDPAEASKLWADFWQKAARDYASETEKLSGAFAELAADTVNRVNEEAVAAMAGKPGK